MVKFNIYLKGELCIDIGSAFQSAEDKTVKVTLLFGQTHIYATATNKYNTEIKNCEFKFDCHWLINKLNLREFIQFLYII